MITIDKIKLYIRFKGDIDGWARGAVRKKTTMTDEDWYLISDLLHGIILVEKGLASYEFEQKLISKLIDNCLDQDTVDEMKETARSHPEFY